MNAIQILKSKLVKLEILESLPTNKRIKNKFNKEQFLKDAREVRETFKDEDLQPRFSTF